MTTPDFSSKNPVLVTGATGYIAGWLVMRLLEEGKSVHAAVRDPSSKDKIAHLEKMAEKSPGTIRFFKADLLDQGSYDEAMEGCDVVFHTASPFTSKINDPQRDLVDPAVKGTQNVLQSVNDCSSVKRVVLTSSCAAVYGDAVDVGRSLDKILTEENWNTTSRLDHQPYSFSKVEAEKQAWRMANAQKRWKLVVINPTLVIGPGVADWQTSESFAIIRQFGDGSFKPGVPDLEIGVVDVRDVAEAHILAGFVKQAEGRHIISEKTLSMLEMGQLLSKTFGNKYPFPQRQLPKWLLWLVGPMLNHMLTREFVAKNFGYRFKADHSKSVQKLGLQYHSSDDAIVAMFQYLIDKGQLDKAKSRSKA